MRASIIAVGTRMPKWIDQGIADYQKRFPPGFRVQLREIPAARRGRSASMDKTLQKEAEQIRAAVPAGSRLILLDERGKKQGTRALAETVAGWMRTGQPVALVIGGADGLHAGMRETAAEIWSLSDFTLPHGLVRIILMEQLYRAWTLLENHPYHRE